MQKCKSGNRKRCVIFLNYFVFSFVLCQIIAIFASNIDYAWALRNFLTKFKIMTTAIHVWNNTIFAEEVYVFNLGQNDYNWGTWYDIPYSWRGNEPQGLDRRELVLGREALHAYEEGLRQLFEQRVPECDVGNDKKACGQ